MFLNELKKERVLLLEEKKISNQLKINYYYNKVGKRISVQ